MAETKRRKISEYTPDPENANLHSERGLDMIGKSLQQVGLGRSIVVDKNGVIIAGNGVVETAVDKGFEDAIEVETTGDTLVVVRRTDLDLLSEDDHRGRMLGYFDNRSAQVSLTWSAAQLLEDMKSKPDVLAPVFTAEELKTLIAPALQKEAGDVPDAKLDQIEEVHKKWGAQPGDLWLIPSKSELGEHRVFCGDSTKEEDVKQALGDLAPNLCMTDPPYGVEYDPEWREKVDIARGGDGGNHALGKVQNDDIVDWSPAFRLFPGNVLYVWHAGVWAPEVGVSIKSCGFDIRGQIIWRKQAPVMSRGAYHWQHEPSFYAVRKGKTANWQGDRKQSTVWDVANMSAVQGSTEDKPTGHSTQKSASLYVRCFVNHSQVGDAVYDPFLGSGTAIAAAESISRIGCGLEIDPRYISVILERLSEMGLTPVRQNPAN